MQICYRCSRETHTRLTEEANKKGISRNRLMDGIIHSYLNQESLPGFPPGYSRQSRNTKEILAAVRLASEKLAGILESVNRFPFYTASEGCRQEADAFFVLRSEIIGNLLDISGHLETVCTPTEFHKTGCLDTPETSAHTKEASSHV